jgi:hypothetical protein
MGETKYKAWDLKNKEMVKVLEILWDTNGKIIEITTETYTHFPQEATTCILMQYTGQDKNGKEIYENV